MKLYYLKEKYKGFRIHAYDERFSKDLSQGECELLYNSGFQKFFDVIEVDDAPAKRVEEPKIEDIKETKQKVRAVKPKRTKRKTKTIVEKAKSDIEAYTSVKKSEDIGENID